MADIIALIDRREKSAQAAQWTDEDKPMNQRAKEHYEIAKLFGSRIFERPEFIASYQERFPKRSLNSIYPTDYCAEEPDRNSPQTERLPKFLTWRGRGRYQLIEGE